MKNDLVEELFMKYYNDALLYTLSLTKNYLLAEEMIKGREFTIGVILPSKPQTTRYRISRLGSLRSVETDF